MEGLLLPAQPAFYRGRTREILLAGVAGVPVQEGVLALHARRFIEVP